MSDIPALPATTCRCPALLFCILMQPKFLYFDLGKVLVNFSTDQMLRQVGAVAGVGADEVRATVFAGGLMREFESGRLSDREFHEAFCTAIGRRPDFDALAAAASDIFDLNTPMLPLVAQLRQAGYRMGILSNTCVTHWEYCRRHYRIVADGFDVHALSFRIGAVKPEAAIFRAAAELAGVASEEIFFVDDIAEHVAGARAVGFDAVQFTGVGPLSADLRRRGVRCNY
jgi:glucose-1-phosphatase